MTWSTSLGTTGRSDADDDHQPPIRANRVDAVETEAAAARLVDPARTRTRRATDIVLLSYGLSLGRAALHHANALPHSLVGTYDWPMAFERITVDPDRMGGVPCIRDLRVTVSMVLGQLAGGHTIDEVLGDYPYLEREDILAALEFASMMVNEREVPVARPA